MAVALYVPDMRELYRFSFLHPIDIVICLVVGIFSVIWLSVLPRKWTVVQ
jgi:Ca2+-transporting ATPase